jgi:PEP-CTERM motif
LSIFLDFLTLMVAYGGTAEACAWTRVFHAKEVNHKKSPMIRKPGEAKMKAKKALASVVWMLQSTVITILLAASAIQSRAQIFTIGARNTSLQINLAGGLSNWTINGVNQLNQQWFYYSIGSGPVYSIDTIAPWTTPTLGGSVAFGTIINTNLSETYANSAQSLTTAYNLQSGAVGSPSATLGSTITFQNTSGTNEVLHFYQYSNFGLENNAAGQTVHFSGSGLPYQVNQNSPDGASLTGRISSISGGTGDTVEETAGITDGLQFGLANGNSAPNFSGPFSAGPGNVNFAYEMDAALTSGTGLVISETQALTIPEPSSVTLMGLGMMGLAISRARRLIFLKK